MRARRGALFARAMVGVEIVYSRSRHLSQIISRTETRHRLGVFRRRSDGVRARICHRRVLASYFVATAFMIVGVTDYYGDHRMGDCASLWWRNERPAHETRSTNHCGLCRRQKPSRLRTQKSNGGARPGES